MASMIADAESGFEPIPGYVLRDKIGVGGYGEVWLADAPGGLKKAIKFVFGTVDQERAGSELRSLQRIRAVNHPFILSLERIEIVDSRLMVVTELADGSLLDRFREFHERGLVGIPRDRLIEYMRDSADALDFLCQRHDLQHLDVKPANLLLVADRIKVADFGLIKDVQRNSMSLMGGMTPTYAAPEMFDGRPGRYSDQYSLAIVYQEMLTGALPFRGRTTAQLANEHLHKAPILEDLPPTERGVIARALSKKPSQRFGSCRELIDALVAANDQATAKRLQSRSESNASRSASPIVPVSEKRTPSRSAGKPIVAPDPKLTLSWSDSNSDVPSTERREVTWLPPLDLSQAPVLTLSPALFIGFGGTGAEILTSLRSRLQSTGIDLKEQTDLGWLLVDTDEKTVQVSTDPGTNGRLLYEHILLTPLKSSQQYRERPQEPFSPVSRRWLYNVPRSQTTEGVRPLAMVAYLDHAVLCHRVLEQLIRDLIDPANVPNENADSPRPSIRIYLAGSVHGGTGSVLSIEFAFLIQRLLEDLEVQATIQLVLTAAKETPMIAYELATAAGAACLNEINHYSRSAGLYPGIPTLPDYNPSKAPWDYVYLVHGGKLGNSAEWYSAIEQIIDFLCMDACTSLGTALDKERLNSANGSGNGEQHEWTDWVKTFGSEKLSLGSKLNPESFVRHLSLQTLQPWIQKFSKPIQTHSENQSQAVTSQIDFFVNDLFRENRWTAQSWVRYVMDALTVSESASTNRGHCLTSPGVCPPLFASLLTPNLETAIDLPSNDFDQIIEQLGLSIETSQNQAREILLSASNTLCNAICSNWLKSTDKWLSLSELLDEVRRRLMQQGVSLESVAQRFRKSKDSLQDNIRTGNIESQGVNAKNQIRNLEFQAAVHSFAGQQLSRLSEHVKVLCDVWFAQSKGLLDQFRLWSHSLANDLDVSVDANGLVRDDRTALPGAFGNARRAVQHEINTQLLDFIRTRFLEGIQNRSRSTSPLKSQTLEAESPKTVDRFVDHDSLNRWIERSVQLLTDASKDLGYELVSNADDYLNLPDSSQFDSLYKHLQSHELPMLSDGGAKRAILMVPSGTVDVEELLRWQATLQFKITIVEMDGLKSAQLYFEGEQMNITTVAHQLWLPTQERSQLAERLHSRNDIDWLPMR